MVTGNSGLCFRNQLRHATLPRCFHPNDTPGPDSVDGDPTRDGSSTRRALPGSRAWLHDGGNLLTIAQTLPDASLVGVDVSPRQVAEGQAQAKALGADKVDLLVANMSEVDSRSASLTISSATASIPGSPSGSGANPGNLHPEPRPQRLGLYQLQHIPRLAVARNDSRHDALHTTGITEPTGRIRQAREVVDFVARSALIPESPYANCSR